MGAHGGVGKKAAVSHHYNVVNDASFCTLAVAARPSTPYSTFFSIARIDRHHNHHPTLHPSHHLGVLSVKSVSHSLLYSFSYSVKQWLVVVDVAFVVVVS